MEFTLHDHSPQIQIEDIYYDHETIRNLFTSLAEKVSEAHISQYIEIGSRLNQLRYRMDRFGIWATMEHNLKNLLHSFDLQ